jgi:hypothetical protein
VIRSCRSWILWLLILSKKTLTLVRRSLRSDWCLLCASYLTVGGTYVRLGEYQWNGRVLRSGRYGVGGRYYFLGPFQPTEVTNRPLNINLIKFFRKYDKSSKPPQI